MIRKDKKLRRNLIIAGILVLMLIMAAGYTVFLEPMLNQETYVYKEETVKRGNLVLGIMERGNLAMGESAVRYDLNLNVSDEEEEDSSEDEEENPRYLKVAEVLAVEGQRIKQGDALFLLTDESVEGVRRKLSAALAEAEIALSEAMTDYQTALISAQQTFDANTVTGSRAAAEYEAALSRNSASVTSLEAEIKVLEQEITYAQMMLEDEDLLDSYEEAKTAYTQAKNKYEETDFHNATAYVSNLAAYETASASLEQLEEQFQGYRDVIADNQEEIIMKQSEIATANNQKVVGDAEAAADYKNASLTGELADEIYEYSTAGLSDTVEGAQNDVDELREKYDAFEAFVGTDNVIYAEADGLVLDIAYSAEDQLINTGAMLTYTQADDYTVTIHISEEDIVAVKVGSSVELAFTAEPDTVYQGTVASITAAASSEYATISYPVTIHVDGDTSRLYGGMTADVTFVTDSVENVLYISRKAVFAEKDSSYVYRKDNNGNREKVAVETGFSDGISIEIISGLAEGDIVYIESVLNVTEGTDGTATGTFSEDNASEENNASDNNASDDNAAEGNGSGGDFPEGGFSEGGFPEGSFPEGGFPGGGFPEGGFQGGGFPGGFSDG